MDELLKYGLQDYMILQRNDNIPETSIWIQFRKIQVFMFSEPCLDKMHLIIAHFQNSQLKR